jgi:hypothetical protein
VALWHQRRLSLSRLLWQQFLDCSYGASGLLLDSADGMPAVMGRTFPTCDSCILSSRTSLCFRSRRFYQRLLARNGEAALEMAEDILKKNSLEYLYSDDHTGAQPRGTTGTKEP